jgi:hypothetical protein
LWSADAYPVQNGVIGGSGMTFSIDWSNEGFTCDYDFTTVSATALSGTSVCASNTQQITADRTCP